MPDPTPKFALVYTTLSAARTIQEHRHPNKAIVHVGRKFMLVDPPFAKRMKLRTVQ